MTEALLSPEKLPFAKLFLELGFGMNKFLTPDRLSQLYASSYKNCLYFRDVCNWIKGGGVQPDITFTFSETLNKLFFTSTQAHHGIVLKSFITKIEDYMLSIERFKSRMEPSLLTIRKNNRKKNKQRTEKNTRGIKIRLEDPDRYRFLKIVSSELFKQFFS